MAAELKDGLSVETELIEGKGGVFDIKVDGKLVYSKKQTHQFPGQGEALRLVRGG